MTGINSTGSSNGPAGQAPGPAISPAPGPREGQLLIASCNLNFAGITRGGDDSRWQASITTLRDWDPDIILLQEMATPPGVIAGLQRHLWRTANELGMTPVLGPPGPLSVTGNHPAILVSTSRGLRILDAGPPLWGSGGGPLPSWCQVLVHVPGIPHPVAVYSVHLPARSADEQRSQAQRLASVIAQKGEITIVGGDWNSFPRDGAALRDLDAMPPHLRPPRMRTRPGPGGVIELEPSYDVDDILTGIGLTDAAASLPPERRDPPDLCATSIYDNGRIDRFYLTPGLPAAAGNYIQAETGGSDHHALLLTLSRDRTAAITPREPAP
jgi:endonuclease/exonuclease/phosphatase family metal-dependent hydrolase